MLALEVLVIWRSFILLAIRPAADLYDVTFDILSVLKIHSLNISLKMIFLCAPGMGQMFSSDEFLYPNSPFLVN